MGDVQERAGTSTEVVRAFLGAMQDGDPQAVLSLIDDDIVYTNVSLPTIRGRAKFEQGAKAYYRRMGFDVRIERIAADGNTVLTERIDQLILGPLRMQLWVCGTFEVVDGRIRLWRDYFDWANATMGLLRALAGVALPFLRPKPLSRR